MDIVIKIIIGIKITNNLSDDNGYYNQKRFHVSLHLTFCTLQWIL